MNFPDECMINAAKQVKGITFIPTISVPHRNMYTLFHDTIRFGEPIRGFLFEDRFSQKIFSFELFIRDGTYTLHVKNTFTKEESDVRCYQLGCFLLEEMKTFAFTDPSFRLKMTMNQYSFVLSEKLKSLSKGEPS